MYVCYTNCTTCILSKPLFFSCLNKGWHKCKLQFISIWSVLRFSPFRVFLCSSWLKQNFFKDFFRLKQNLSHIITQKIIRDGVRVQCTRPLAYRGSQRDLNSFSIYLLKKHKIVLKRFAPGPRAGAPFQNFLEGDNIFFDLLVHNCEAFDAVLLPYMFLKLA